MVNIMSKSGHTTYGLTEYVLDEEKEVNNLSILDAPGSTAYVIATGNSYILSGGSRTWKKMKLVSAGGSGNSAETEAQITELEAQIAEYQTKEIETTKQINELTVTIQQQRDTLAEKEAQITTLQTNLNNKETELNTTKSELATANEKVEKLSDVKVEGDTLVLPDDLIDTVEEG